MHSRNQYVTALLVAIILSGCAYLKELRAPALPPVQNAAWQEECGSCHMAFHPGMLPARSWHKMMAGLNDHFGTDATVAAETSEEITAFLLANAADVRPESRRSARILRTIPAAETPLRITEVAYIHDMHEDIKAAVFKRPKVKSRANCTACHPDAKEGDFDEHTVEIPD